jgi:hypothetical protein
MDKTSRMRIVHWVRVSGIFRAFCFREREGDIRN